MSLLKNFAKYSLCTALIILSQTQALAAVLKYPDSKGASLQDLIDRAQPGDRIQFTESEFECVRGNVRNKNISFEIDRSNGIQYARIQCDRFTPYILQIEGSSQVSIHGLTLVGGSAALKFVGLGNEFPKVELSNFYTTESVRGLFGSVDELKIRDSGFNSNEGNGVIIQRFRVLDLERVGSSNNLNFGFAFQGALDVPSTLRMKDVYSTENREAGVWLHRIHGEVDIQNFDFSSNYGYNLQISQTSHARLSNGILSTAQWGDLIYSADGLRLIQSFVSARNLTLNENANKGIYTAGCDASQMQIDLFQVETSYTAEDKNWVSGKTQGCSGSRWNWLELNSPSDRIMSDSFESEDSQQNRCFSINGDGTQQQCKATREDMSQDLESFPN